MAKRRHSEDKTPLHRRRRLNVVSLGAICTICDRIDFHPQESDKRRRAEFSLQTPDLSLSIIKPGCQIFVVHRVRSASLSRASCYSLSFRCILPFLKEGSPTAASEAAV